MRNTSGGVSEQTILTKLEVVSVLKGRFSFFFFRSSFCNVCRKCAPEQCELPRVASPTHTTLALKASFEFLSPFEGRYKVHQLSHAKMLQESIQ